MDSVADGCCIDSRPGIPSLPCVQTLGVVYQSRKGSVLCALVLVFWTPLSVTVGVTHAWGTCVTEWCLEHSVV